MGEGMTPSISVVMPVWNIKENKLIRSIESILTQTFTDFEFIIVADEPTKGVQHICNQFQRSDSRITIIYQMERQGLSRSLNTGIALAKGKYIARMDADDISYPTRLKKQYDFMEAHPEVGISGTNHYMDRKGRTYPTFYLTKEGEMNSRSLFGPVLAHPTVIFRSSFIKNIPGPYDPDFLHAEDYELWVRCIGKTKMTNLEEILVYIENDGDNVSDRFLAIQEETAVRIRNIAASKFGFPVNNGDFVKWLEDLYSTNEEKKIFPQEFFRRELGRYWYFYCLNHSAFNGLSAWKLYRSHPLYKYSYVSIGMKLKFLGACLIKWRMP